MWMNIVQLVSMPFVQYWQKHDADDQIRTVLHTEQLLLYDKHMLLEEHFDSSAEHPKMEDFDQFYNLIEYLSAMYLRPLVIRLILFQIYSKL